jgi:hypothetical protein
MMAPQGPRPEQLEDREEQDAVAFCGYCGHRPESAPVPRSRVCDACQMGLVLRAPSDSAPARGETFLVVDDLMRIRAVSRDAERLLGMQETHLIGSQVGDVLIPAEVTPDGGAHLAVLVARAAARSAGTVTTAVRPRDTFGVRYAARIGPCSPEPAALIVLAEPL